MSETQLVKVALDFLRMRQVLAWRANSGARVIPAKNGHARAVIQLSPPGTPDILGVVPGTSGQLFGFEAKSPKGKQRPSQVTWQREAELRGVRYAVVRSLDDVREKMEEWTGEPY